MRKYTLLILIILLFAVIFVKYFKNKKNNVLKPNAHKAVVEVKCNNSNFTFYVPKDNFTEQVKIFEENYNQQVERGIKQPLPKEEFAREYIKTMVNINIMSCCNKDNNIEVTEEEMQRELNRLYKQYYSKEEFWKSKLKYPGTTEEQVKNDIKNTIKNYKLYEKFSTKKITEEDIKKEYENNFYIYNLPRKVIYYDVWVDTIFNKIKKQLIKEDKNNKKSAAVIDSETRKIHDENLKTLRELEEKLKQNPEKFIEIGKSYAALTNIVHFEGPKEYQRYDSKLSPEYNETLTDLNIRELSKPTPSQFGTHYLYVTKIIPPRVIPIDQVRDELIYQIYGNNSEFLESLVENYKKNVEIIYYDKKLDPNYTEEKKENKRRNKRK